MKSATSFDDGLVGLPSFARLLASRPHPDEIAAALIEGPLQPFDAFAGILMWLREPSLRMIGLHGYTAEESEGFEEIPLVADLPITQAVRDGEVVIGSGETFETEYTDHRLDDPERWERMRERIPVGSIVSVPIVGRGTVVGAFGFTCRVEREWTPVEISLLETLGHLVAMWVLHPDSALPWPDSSRAALQLTDRQLQVLRLVAAGKTTDGIAATLGYSSSTIKQEIARLLRVLNSSSRGEAVERAHDLGLLETP